MARTTGADAELRGSYADTRQLMERKVVRAFGCNMKAFSYSRFFFPGSMER